MFIDALWSPAGKELTSWLSFVMSNYEVWPFPFGILGKVWCLIALIPGFYPVFTFIMTLAVNSHLDVTYVAAIDILLSHSKVFV